VFFLAEVKPRNGLLSKCELAFYVTKVILFNRNDVAGYISLCR